MKHTPIVLEERSVLSGDIYQHGRKTVISRTSFTPQGRLGTSGIPMTTSAGIAGIHRTQAAVLVAAGTHIIIQPVAVIETAAINARYP